MNNYSFNHIDVVSRFIRHNRTSETNVTDLSEKMNVYKLPSQGVYKVSNIDVLKHLYLLYSASHMLYTKCKSIRCEGENVDVPSTLCSRIAVTHNGLFEESPPTDTVKNLLCLDYKNDTPTNGILLEQRKYTNKVGLQVSLSEELEVLLNSLSNVLNSISRDKFPRKIGIFYETVLNDFPILRRITRPNILVEKTMQEDLPRLSQNSQDILSPDFLTNISLKSYLLANSKLAHQVVEARAQGAHKLVDCTQRVFSSRLGEAITESRYNRKDLYRLLMANLIFGTIYKQGKVAMIEGLTNYIDDQSTDFKDFSELVLPYETTIFYN